MRRLSFSMLLLVTIGALAACSGPKTGTVVNPQINVSVNPPSPTLNVFATQQFSATVTGTSNTSVTWQVNGVTGGAQATGYISSTGVYVAPGGAPTQQDATPIPVTVTAVSKASSSASGSASVTILATPNQSAQSGAVKLGTSGGNVKNLVPQVACCGGTLGSLVTRNGTQFILSNNHVLADSDFGTGGGPPSGDAISQPAIIDAPAACSTTGTKTVANLSEFFNLQTGPTPKVDAAIAQVVSGAVDSSGNILLLGATATNGVPDPGAPAAGAGITPTQAVGAPHNGLVAKSGRTTGLTCASIMATNVSGSITYTQNCDGSGTSYQVSYTGLVQVAGSDFSAEGDSGSLIVTQDTAEAVALLFGGNGQDTIGNAIGDVLNAFPGVGNATPTFVGGATHQVIGCTLPSKPASAMQTLSVAALPGETVQKAVATRDAHGPELMAHPEVQAVGIGASYDNPAEAAIVLFVMRGLPRTNPPLEVDGVRTRIVEGDSFASRGILTPGESAALEQSAAAPQITYPISAGEVAHAKAVQAAHETEWLKQQGVQAVGIASSVDSPGEAALMIYFIKGMAHAAVPPVIDGLRTRVREGERFRAGVGASRPRQGCAVPPAKKAQSAANPAPKA